MTIDTDAVRRWTRILSGLRTRAVKLRRANGAPATPLEALLEESLDTCGGLLQELAGADLLSDRLRKEVHAEAANRQYLLEQMPVACVVTDEASIIQNANQPAADLLNISTKHLRGRLLLHFSADRAAFAQLLQNLPLAGGRVHSSLAMRPRERGAFSLNALVVPETAAGRTSWLWFLQPVAHGVVGMPESPAYAKLDIA